MKKQFLIRSFYMTILIFLVACSKDSSNETVNVSTPILQVGQAVSDATPLSGAIKGTMISGKTYLVSGDIIINAGDTLVIQPGVRVNMGEGINMAVKGTLLSLGSKEKPIWIGTPNLTKTDIPGADMTTDEAYKGHWCGINCDTSCKLLVIKWTHIEYVGAKFTTSLVNGNKVGNSSYGIFFQNPNGVFVLEDSWMYGTTDDAIRPNGKFCIMRNTFEKCGAPGNGGDIINVKSGGSGDAAYNLFIGGATNGTKASNKGGSTVQANCCFYNNTYIHMGYKQPNPTGRAGSWNFEEGAKGMAYNGLLVNCRTGLRIVISPLADTTNIKYGYNYNYGDSQSVMNWVYPPADLTIPQSSDIPSFTPIGYTWGQAMPVYTAPSNLVTANNPQFVNFPLPAKVGHLIDVQAVGSFDFHLQSSSPAIGKGYTSFTPISISTNHIPKDANYGATDITLPGADIGCYQINGKGNQH